MVNMHAHLRCENGDLYCDITLFCVVLIFYTVYIRPDSSNLKLCAPFIITGGVGFSASDRLWMGLHKESGSWKWTNGEATSYYTWANDNPNTPVSIVHIFL